MTQTIDQTLKYAAQLKKKIADARKRAESSLVYKQGETPPFSFSEMMAKEAAISNELAKIQGKLAVANATNTIEYKNDNISLSHAIRLLQELKGRIAWINGLGSLANEQTYSTEAIWDDQKSDYLRKQVVTICNLPEADRAKLVDSLQDEFNLLNGLVDSANKTITISLT